MSLTKVTYSMIEGTPINVKDFGAVGDGTTDDTAAIQAALDAWKIGGYDLIFSSGSTFKVTSTLLVDFSTTNTQPKSIHGYGSVINGSTIASGDVFKITVTGSLTLVRNLIIAGLQITGNSSVVGSALVLQGPLAGDSYLYNCKIRDCTLGGYTGLSLLGNFFESSIENNTIGGSASGYAINIDTSGGSGSGSGGVISSLTLYQNMTRGGINGVYISATSNDVNIIGGTYLLAEEYGIRNDNAQGGYILGAHVEANWVSNPVTTSGQAGIYAVISGTYAIKNVFSNCSNGQTHSARVFVSASGCAILDSGVQFFGNEQFYIWGLAGSSAILNGSASYTTPGTIAISINNGLRNLIPIVSKNVSRLSNPASVTPSIAASAYHILLTVTTTINAPSFTSNYGDELTFSFEQAGAGGGTVTWDAVYFEGSFIPTAAFSTISTITFRYLNTSSSSAKWVVVSTGTT